jgi:simple sugar transport system permease protein
MAYLFRQYKVVAVVFIVLMVILGVLAIFGIQNPFVPIAFLTGGFFSGLCGYIGMKTATNASARTTQGASESLNRGLQVAFRSGAVMGLFHAFMSVTLKLDQIIGGTVINILALGLTDYFYQTGLTTEGKFTAIPLGPLAEIPLIGPVLFDNPPITYAAIVLVFVVQFVLFRTKWGLRTRAVGEHPRAADTVGINVYFMRYANVILGGAIAGLAGAFLTLEAVGSFERNMTNGRGFIALAVMLFGKYTPLGAWGAALFFGFTTAMQTQLQFAGINVPHQFIGMIPYLTTILVLAGFVGRTRVPAADGVPYEKE